jgi:hypothetical protein
LYTTLSGAGFTQERREGSRSTACLRDKSESSILTSEGIVVYRKKMGQNDKKAE